MYCYIYMLFWPLIIQLLHVCVSVYIYTYVYTYNIVLYIQINNNNNTTTNNNNTIIYIYIHMHRELWQCVSGRGSTLIRCYAECVISCKLFWVRIYEKSSHLELFSTSFCGLNNEPKLLKGNTLVCWWRTCTRIAVHRPWDHCQLSSALLK